MNCNEANELISLFIDDALPPTNHDPLFKHLSDCSECRLYLQGMLRIRKIEHREQVAYPSALDAKILAMAGLKSSKQSNPIWQRSIRLSFPVAAAAIFLIVLLSVILSNLLFPADRTRTARQDVSYAQQQQDKVTVIYGLPALEVHPEPSAPARK